MPPRMQDDLSRHYNVRLQRLHRLSHLLDSKFRLPGTTYRFGLDSLLGLIPGIGDTVGLLLSSYILFEAKNLGAPTTLLLRMAANIGIDALVGTVPLLGDVFDVAWQANAKNLALLQNHLEKYQQIPGA